MADVKSKLQSEMEAAKRALYKLKAAKEREHDERLSEFGHELFLDLKKHDPSINKASKALHEATKKYHEYCQDHPQKIDGIEIGMKMVEWQCRGFSWDTNIPQRPVRKGIVQVFRIGDEADISRWDRPKPGDLIIRHIKKDGTPGKRIAVARGGIEKHFHNWHPEGVDPNKTK